jgi:hypothetical protein
MDCQTNGEICDGNIVKQSGDIATNGKICNGKIAIQIAMLHKHAMGTYIHL